MFLSASLSASYLIWLYIDEWLRDFSPNVDSSYREDVRDFFLLRLGWSAYIFTYHTVCSIGTHPKRS